jgi:hypothetical protein
MRTLILNRHALSVCVAAILLEACGGSEASRSTMPASSVTPSATTFLSALMRMGIAPKYNGLPDLYVSDLGGVGGPKARIDILKNKTYKYIDEISEGINTPGGNFLDKQGNLYVADQDAVNIKEYAPGATSPTFIYNAGMISPQDVSVDRNGNVFEADWPNGSNGFINEYAQGSNTIIHTCDTGFQVVTGVAVDRKGDVFVDVGSKLIDFKGGLSGCSVKLLVSLNSGGGMALDKNNNVIVADAGNATVDVIAPPYQTITNMLGSGYTTPWRVRINKANTRAFVSDVGLSFRGRVFVLQYPSGALVTWLDSSNGIYEPFSAVDGPNAVY